MNKKTNFTQDSIQLRNAAEALVDRDGAALPGLSVENLQHEYQVSVIELEMQNEALRQAQIDLEKSRDLYLDLYDFSPVGYLTLTQRGMIVEANLTAARLLGRERSQLTGQPLFRYVAADCKDRWYFLLKQVAGQGKPDTQELRFTRSDGSQFYARLDCLYVQRDNEEPGIRVSMLDIGNLSSIERSSREDASRYRALYESMRDAFVLVDMAGNLQLFNQPFQDMLGYSGTELKEKTFMDLTPECWHASEAQMVEQQVLPFGESAVYEKEYIRKDGSIFPVELKAVLLKNANGQAEGMWAVVRDISERKRAEAELAERESRYRIAMQAISVVVYDWNIVSDEVCFSERLRRLFGESFPEGAVVRDWWRDHVHPEDYSMLKVAIRSAIKTPSGRYKMAYRMRHKEGHWLHVVDRGFVLCDAAGVAVRMIGSLTDISARVRAETALRQLNDSLEEQVVERSAELRMRAEQLHESERFIRTTLDALSSAVAVVDESEQLIFTNKGWQELVVNEYICAESAGAPAGAPAGKFAGKFAGEATESPVFNYLPCIEGCVDCKTLVAAQTKVSNAVQSMLAGKRQSFSIEYPCAFGTDTRWFSLRIDRFKGSALLWLIITHEEITERKLAAEELSRVATNFKKMLRKVELAHEEDSKQIAREIHDQLGATLTMLKLGLATSKGNQEVPDTLHSKFDGMIDLADQALQSVKRVTAQLRPSMLDTLGLVAALKWHVKEFSRMTSIAAEIQVPDYIRLSPERGNAVFRIIQESLTNIAKHAHASKVNILARKTKRDLIFVVNDNGVGLQAKQSTRRDSFGVIGMQERAIYLGGNLTLESLPEGGVSMTLQIPMEIKAPKQAEDLFS